MNAFVSAAKTNAAIKVAACYLDVLKTLGNLETEVGDVSQGYRPRELELVREAITQLAKIHQLQLRIVADSLSEQR